jgi:hypothetical protein
MEIRYKTERGERLEPIEEVTVEVEIRKAMFELLYLHMFFFIFSIYESDIVGGRGACWICDDNPKQQEG